MSTLFLKVWQRNFRVWRKFVRASIIGNLGQPFLFLLAMGIGLKSQIPEIEGLTYLQFIAPGLVTSAVMYSAAFETTYGSYTRLSTQRTFEAILMAPVKAEELALGEILWGATKGIISGLIMLIAIPFFGVIPSFWTIVLLPVLLIEGILFASLGLIMTALARNYEFFNYFTSLLITPLFLFSGIFFPISTLSKGVQNVILLLPLTHAVHISRALCYGRFNESLPLNFIVLTAFAIASSWIAIILLKRRLII